MKKPPIEKQAIGLITGLTIEFLLGIGINLYIEFPEGQTAQQLWDYGLKQWPIVLHFILGSLLVLGSFVLVVRVLRSKSVTWKAPALLGFAGILVAWGGGERFVSTQVEAWSFVMATGFIVAIASYAWGLYRASSSKP